MPRMHAGGVASTPLWAQRKAEPGLYGGPTENIQQRAQTTASGGGRPTLGRSARTVGGSVAAMRRGRGKPKTKNTGHSTQCAWSLVAARPHPKSQFTKGTGRAPPIRKRLHGRRYDLARGRRGATEKRHQGLDDSCGLSALGLGRNMASKLRPLMRCIRKSEYRRPRWPAEVVCPECVLLFAADGVA